MIDPSMLIICNLKSRLSDRLFDFHITRVTCPLHTSFRNVYHFLDAKTLRKRDTWIDNS